jgi:Transposase DDE domain
VSITPTDNPLSQFNAVFYGPAIKMLKDYCREEKTGGLSDERFLLSGLERCIGHYDSGRDFLQKLADNGDALARATFFDALKQDRRLSVLKEVTERTAILAAKEMIEVDWLKSIPELKNRQVWAIDGHQIEHACHALRDKGGKRVPVGCLYAFDLHKGLMHPLCTHQGNGRRTAEVKAFRKAFSAKIAQKGFPIRPIVVVDMGFIDGTYWTKLRLRSPDAPVIITRQKENMNPVNYGNILFDRLDPVNAGVVHYEMVGFNNCLQMYRITYKDPENGAEFVFLTSDSTLKPGVVALLYRLRWKIEKTYNTCKSKLHLTKAWANGDIAQQMQAHFTVLTHNLLTLLQYKLVRDQKITEVKLVKKHDIIAEKRKENNIPDHPFHLIARLALQLSAQFIRLVRTLLHQSIAWFDTFPQFEERMKKYL